MFETFGVLEHLLLAIEEARRAADLPIVAEMTFGEELIALDGTTPAAAAIALAAAGADVMGVNCGAGPYACLDALGGNVRRGGPRRSVMPNAGLPRRVDGRFVYTATPAYFAGSCPRRWPPARR